jgi:hypothetical protein
MHQRCEHMPIAVCCWRTNVLLAHAQVHADCPGAAAGRRRRGGPGQQGQHAAALCRRLRPVRPPWPKRICHATVLSHSRLQQGWQRILGVAAGLAADRLTLVRPAAVMLPFDLSMLLGEAQREVMLADALFSQSTSLLCSGEFVASLLEAGANGAVKNDSDHTPYELVRWAGSTVTEHCSPFAAVVCTSKDATDFEYVEQQ